MTPIRIAFIKLAGLVPGGTEKFLQTIATNLPSDEFKVTFFTGELKEPHNGLTTDPSAEQRLRDAGVEVVKVQVHSVERRKPHRWIGTDLWELFDEDQFDIVQTGRAGYREFPFTELKRVRIVDSIHLNSGVHNQSNIVRVMHISPSIMRSWVRAGGDESRATLVSHPIADSSTIADLRNEIKAENSLIFGMHQRPDDAIFSEVPLAAYSQVETMSTAYAVLGGSKQYAIQANDLGLRNFSQLPFTTSPDRINQFLNSLDVYSHGRFDGEVNSTAIAEAMRSSLPIVSHRSRHLNGHVDSIGDAGVVVGTRDVDGYARELKELIHNDAYRKERSDASRRRFIEMYEFENQMERICEVYRSALDVPLSGLSPLARSLSLGRQQLARLERWGRGRGWT